ncbi:MAG: YbaB/EbfC family nucleoid-associated protein [Chloroflexi bacterium]|nr:YbaB/EbfC family nucleoid-associated protein [Chloroflexota bacterium]
MARKGRSRTPGPRGSMLKQLEEMQKQMAETQAALEEEIVTASVGGGVITVEMTGAQEVRSVTIKPEILDPEDVEILQDMLVAAFNEALQKAQKLAADKFGPLAGGIDIPGLF